MALLTADQVKGYANAAGFKGGDLRIIVAIAQAESGVEKNAVMYCDTLAHNPGGPGDVEDSWGVWQINRDAHPEVSVAQACDPVFAATYAFRLYKAAGNKFTDWGTYTRKEYQDTPYWKSSAPGLPQIIPSAPWTAQDSAEVWPWLTRDGKTLNTNNPYHSDYERQRSAVQDGIGIATGLDEVITSLTSGTVMAAAFGQDLAPAGANWNYGGFIIIRSQLPNVGWADVFYRHMDTIEVKKGDSILVGQRIGLSGGQTTGGHHPESTAFSSGAHIDIGENPNTLPFTSIGPNRDPTPWLSNLIKSGPPTRDRLHLIVGGATQGSTAGTAVGVALQQGVLLSDQVAAGTGPVADSFLGIEQRMDEAMAFIPIDWTTATAGTHWWDYALPWQWQKTSNTVQANITTAIVHDVEAFSLRALLVTIGLFIIIGVAFNIITSANKAAENVALGGDAQQTAIKAVNLAKVAAV